MKIAAYNKISLAELNTRAQKARELSSPCTMCPKACGVDRTQGEEGDCGIGDVVKISSANLHHGEEPPISGWRGSGTIFFTGCNLACVFCQNFPISQLRHGEEMSHQQLAQAMIRLQSREAHNINLVSPSHMVWHFLEALVLAREQGLVIPIVYNSSGYDAVDSLKLLDSVIDIYMPDLKYGEDKAAQELSNADDYWDTATGALLEMQRQVGSLEIDSEGVATKGLLVRHLVLPEELSSSKKVLGFLSEKLGKRTFVSLMSQYFPAHKAVSMPPLDRHA